MVIFEVLLKVCSRTSFYTKVENFTFSFLLTLYKW